MRNLQRTGMAPPLPRAWLDTIAPALRLLFGLIFDAAGAGHPVGTRAAEYYTRRYSRSGVDCH
jgi:hypothetical protein